MGRLHRKNTLEIVCHLFVSLAVAACTAGPKNKDTQSAQNTVPIDARDMTLSLNEDSSVESHFMVIHDGTKALTFAFASQPAHGSVTLLSNNRFRYVPDANYFGSDSFDYEVVSTDGQADSAKVSLTIRSVNDAPTVSDVSFSLEKNGAKAITLSATDIENGTLTYRIVSHPSHGTISGNISAGNITYRPHTNYHGVDSFTYAASDGTASSPAARVTLQIANRNTAPQANALLVDAFGGIPVDFRVNGSDADGDSLHYILVSSPAVGTLSGTIPNLRYQAPDNHVGNVTFRFRVSDNSLESADATVTVRVRSIDGVNRLFISSETFSSDLGGLAGADAHCQRMANSAGLTGRWKALLSDSAQHARNRLSIPGPVYDMLGTRLAVNAADFWDGELTQRVLYDETKRWTGVSIVWTGTDTDGYRDRGPYTTWCGNWTGRSGGVEAGRTDQKDYRWVSIYHRGDQSAHACSNMSRLYCLSQP